MAQTSTATDTTSETAIIAAQNDQFRTAILKRPAEPQPIQGRLLVTPGVMAKGEGFMQQALQLTAGYVAFHTDSDPYGLHEMGVIEVQATKLWWKIDLYDTDYRYGSDAPADPEQTRRVLTILLPSEY